MYVNCSADLPCAVTCSRRLTSQIACKYPSKDLDAYQANHVFGFVSPPASEGTIFHRDHRVPGDHTGITRAGGHRARGWGPRRLCRRDGRTDGLPGIFYQEIVEVRFPRAETVEAWAGRMNRSGRYLCQCGRGAELVILPRHRSMGLPRYVYGHHSNPLRRGFDALCKKGYKLVGEVAELLGVSENTVRRMEEEGIIPRAQRFGLAHGKGKSVREFTAKEVERIARSRTRRGWCGARRQALRCRIISSAAASTTGTTRAAGRLAGGAA